MENISDQELEFLQKTRDKQSRLHRTIVISGFFKLSAVSFFISMFFYLIFLNSKTSIGTVILTVFLAAMATVLLTGRILFVLWKPKDWKFSYDKTANEKLKKDILITNEIENRYNQFIELQAIQTNRLIEQREEENRKSKDYWTHLDGAQFEIDVSKVFQLCGFSVKVTGGPGDGGIDILMERNNIKYIVQCKNHKKRIPPNIIVKFNEALNKSKAHIAILVSSSGVTTGVWNYIKDKPIHIVDINILLSMNSYKRYSYRRKPNEISFLVSN